MHSFLSNEFLIMLRHPNSIYIFAQKVILKQLLFHFSSLQGVELSTDHS